MDIAMPYRTTLAKASKKAGRDLWVVFAVVWTFACARVVLGLYRHQTFDAELTLAALAIVLIPALLRG